MEAHDVRVQGHGTVKGYLVLQAGEVERVEAIGFDHLDGKVGGFPTAGPVARVASEDGPKGALADRMTAHLEALLEVLQGCKPRRSQACFSDDHWCIGNIVEVGAVLVGWDHCGACGVPARQTRNLLLAVVGALVVVERARICADDALRKVQQRTRWSSARAGPTPRAGTVFTHRVAKLLLDVDPNAGQVHGGQTQLPVRPVLPSRRAASSANHILVLASPEIHGQGDLVGVPMRETLPAGLQDDCGLCRIPFTHHLERADDADMLSRLGDGARQSEGNAWSIHLPGHATRGKAGAHLRMDRATLGAKENPFK
mmetsp:Transcript_18518/g.41945  ORF Transcript_18518/g.41945 Transcript_18518/m.41945 type:complete len:313 (+) Transcript_18518:847-1785(+)